MISYNQCHKNSKLNVEKAKKLPEYIKKEI